MKEGRVVANGIEFAFLEEGSGPLLLLLHGHPDNAWTWEHQMAPFAAAGHRVVAPFLRGHPPTEIPARGYYDRATLALDLKALIEVLAPDGRADVGGQDWGAAMTYGFLAAFPDLVRRAVVMAIPHAGAVQESLVEPAQIPRAFPWWFSNCPRCPSGRSRPMISPSSAICGIIGRPVTRSMLTWSGSNRCCAIRGRSPRPSAITERRLIRPCRIRPWLNCGHGSTVRSACQLWRCAAPTTSGPNR